MRHSLDPRRILFCAFSPHVRNGSRKFSVPDLVLYGIVPAMVGVLVVWRIGIIGFDYLPLVLGAYAILSAVLVGLLPLVYSVIGQTDRYRKYTAGERPILRQELQRLETLQDLYSTISYSTLLLVVAMFACIALGFAPKSVDTATPAVLWAVRGLSAFVYFVGASTALSVLNVGNGVFDAMEDQVSETKRSLSADVVQDPPEK